jgi:hypothetical protein
MSHRTHDDNFFSTYTHQVLECFPITFRSILGLDLKINRITEVKHEEQKLWNFETKSILLKKTCQWKFLVNENFFEYFLNVFKAKCSKNIGQLIDISIWDWNIVVWYTEIVKLWYVVFIVKNYEVSV